MNRCLLCCIALSAHSTIVTGEMKMAVIRCHCDNVVSGGVGGSGAEEELAAVALVQNSARLVGDTTLLKAHAWSSPDMDDVKLTVCVCYIRLC